MKTSDVFKLAKRRLARNHTEVKYTWDVAHNGREQFICVALLRLVGKDKRINVHDRDRCIGIIEDLMGGMTGSLESWLIDAGHVPISYRFGTDEAIDKMQVTRHAWLDHLIKHYRKLGD